MGRNEADTRAQLIGPALHQRGWTEERHIRREQTPGAIDIVQGRGKRRSRGRMDYGSSGIPVVPPRCSGY